MPEVELPHKRVGEIVDDVLDQVTKTKETVRKSVRDVILSILDIPEAAIKGIKEQLEKGPPKVR